MESKREFVNKSQSTYKKKKKTEIFTISLIQRDISREHYISQSKESRGNL